MGKYLDDVFYAYQQARNCLLQRTPAEDQDNQFKQFNDILFKSFSSRENPRRILRCVTNVGRELTRHPHTYIFETLDNGSLLMARYDDETELCKRLDIMDRSSFECLLLKHGKTPEYTKISYVLPVDRSRPYTDQSIQDDSVPLEERTIELMSSYIEDLATTNRFRNVSGDIKPQQFLNSFYENDSMGFSLGEKLDAHTFTSQSILILSQESGVSIHEIIEQSNTELDGTLYEQVTPEFMEAMARYYQRS